MELLGIDYPTLEGMLYGPELPWAWDIGLGTGRREIRIWRDCLHDQWQGRACTERDDAKVFASLFVHSRPDIKSPELKRVFSCSHNHIFSLIHAGLLITTLRQTRGVHGYAKISRESIHHFLRSRSVSAVRSHNN